MYLLVFDGVVYDRDKDGNPVRLPAVLKEFRGVAGVKIRRLDGTLVAEHVGSDTEFIHAPTGRHIRRRKCSPNGRSVSTSR